MGTLIHRPITVEELAKELLSLPDDLRNLPISIFVDEDRMERPIEGIQGSEEKIFLMGG